MNTPPFCLEGNNSPAVLSEVFKHLFLLLHDGPAVLMSKLEVPYLASLKACLIVSTANLLVTMHAGVL